MEEVDQLLKDIDTKIKETEILTREEVNTVYKKSVMKVMGRIFEQQLIYTYSETGTLPGTENMRDDLKQLVDDHYKRFSTKPPYYFVTISPRPGVEFDEIQKAVKRYLNKSTIHEYFYVYEVRYEDLTGLHVHILLRTTDKPANFKRGTRNTFKHICNAEYDRILNFKNIAEEFLPDKISYMMGNKQDDKKAGVRYSVEWRHRNGVPEFFESTPPFPCRGVQKTPVLEIE